jgi:hypothetical protein
MARASVVGAELGRSPSPARSRAWAASSRPPVLPSMQRDKRAMIGLPFSAISRSGRDRPRPPPLVVTTQRDGDWRAPFSVLTQHRGSHSIALLRVRAGQTARQNQRLLSVAPTNTRLPMLGKQLRRKMAHPASGWQCLCGAP